MNKIKLIDPIALRAQCEAQIVEYRARHRVGVAYRAFLLTVMPLLRVDRRITKVMYDKLSEHGFARGSYTLSYHKDTDFMNRDRFTITVTWQTPDRATDRIQWHLGQAPAEADRILLNFSLLQKHANFLQSRLIELEYMVLVHNRAVGDLQKLAENTVDGLYSVYPLSDAFHYYELK